MGKSNKNSEKRLEAIAVHSDLDRLQKSKAFQEAVLGLKGDVMGTQDLCYRFLIGDMDWIQHVIRHWDGKSPLPRTEDPKVYRSPITHRPPKGASFSPITLGYWEGNFFATLKGFFGGTDNYFDGSPHLRKQSLFQRDESGEVWVTLRIRLTEDLTEDHARSWMHDEIFKAKKCKKPSGRDLVLSLLAQYPQNTRNKTIYGVTQYIMKDLKSQLDRLGLSVKESQAKDIARKWVEERKKI